MSSFSKSRHLESRFQALAALIRAPYKWSEGSMSECSRAVNNTCCLLGSPP